MRPKIMQRDTCFVLAGFGIGFIGIAVGMAEGPGGGFAFAGIGFVALAIMGAMIGDD